MKRTNTLPNFRRFLAWPGVLVTSLVVIGTLTLTLKAGDILTLMAAAAASFTGATTTLYITPYTDSNLLVGETSKVDVMINSRVPINALGATISFPTDLIEIVGFSKEKSFLDLWTEETAIREDVGEIHFSGGTFRDGGMIGTGTVLTLTIKPKHPGRATLAFTNTEVFPNDGLGISMRDETRSLTIVIPEPTKQVATNTETQSQTTVSQSVPEKPLPRTPDVNTDGAVNLVDVSIMIMRLVMPYDFHFDLDMDGGINLSDLSIVLAASR